MRGDKRREVRVAAILITIAVISLLIFSGPAQAFSISLFIPDNQAEKGESIVFTGEIKINSQENIPADYLILGLSGPMDINCSFYPNASIKSGCLGILIKQIQNSSYGYGYGYGYYGYGYNFGYGYGFEEGRLIYEFTLNTSEYEIGEYKSRLSLIAAGKEFSEDGNTIKITDPYSFDLKVYSPTLGIYNTKRIQFNISTSREVERIEYKQSETDYRWKILCKDCKEYGELRKKSRVLKEGENNITIRAENKNIIKEENISIFIDSKDPKIHHTKPIKGYTDGNFLIEYREENPKEIWIVYGNNTSKKSSKVDISKCFEGKRNNTECNIFINLSEFDEQNIFYWFNITDIAGNYDESRIKKIRVDFSKPRVNEFYILQNKRKVDFFINITEPFFDEVNYIDIEKGKNAKSVLLCTKLEDGICEKDRWFSRGEHNLTLEILDDAGNQEKIGDVIFDI